MNITDIYKRQQATITDLNWVIPFGKHKGLKLSEVLTDNPDYILWLQDNTDLDFDHTIIDKACGDD